MSNYSEPSQNKPTLTEIMIKLKPFFLIVMLFPLVGMIIAAILIFQIKPNNMELIIGLIIFLMMVYLGTIYYISKRIDSLKNNKS
ncbi:hypothetical protein JW865_05255 [Candidatus Bathyarchaeota archaeon]|nr:hypothetical protein [Candidatus Bathyarchaeota archaeon]